MHFVTPCNWLADCVRGSMVMRDRPVTVAPNPIDTDRWKPLDQAMALAPLGLSADRPLLLFGALGVGRDPRKGFDPLLEALAHLRVEGEDLHLLVFLQLAPPQSVDLGFPIHYTGHLHDDLSLRTLYSALGLLVLPSRQDNLPNTGVETHACGTPVEAFDAGGLPDIVEHKCTGYLARAFDTRDLAQGVAWVLAEVGTGRLHEQARARAVSQFGSMSLADRYLAVYEATLESGQMLR